MERMAEKLRKGEFDLEDMAEQFRQMQRMGGLGGLMGMLPGARKAVRIERVHMEERAKKAVLGLLVDGAHRRMHMAWRSWLGLVSVSNSTKSKRMLARASAFSRSA